MFWIEGGELILMRGWTDGPAQTSDRRWTVEELAKTVPTLLSIR